MPAAEELEVMLRRDVLEVWFPRCLDTEHGGFLCDFDRAWHSSGPHDKFLEFQARQTWLAAMAYRRYPDNEGLRAAAQHGLDYLRTVMWDERHGGWFHRLDRAGAPVDEGRKHAHGSAYAIAACAEASVALDDLGALQLARAGFDWLDAHARDRAHGGYFGFLARDGTVIRDPSATADGMDPIGTPIGLKDANVNGDLTETLVVLMAVEPRPAFRDRLAELVGLMLERMRSPEGVLHYCFRPDWAPLPGSAFGAGFQTTHRLVDAAEWLGGKPELSGTAVRIFDRTVELAWNADSGGFRLADFGPRPDRKEWWLHFECLRALAALSAARRDDGLADRVWTYVRARFLDERRGGFYMEAQDGASAAGTAKGCIWKDGWHEGATLLAMLAVAEGS